MLVNLSKTFRKRLVDLPPKLILLSGRSFSGDWLSFFFWWKYERYSI